MSILCIYKNVCKICFSLLKRNNIFRNYYMNLIKKAYIDKDIIYIRQRLKRIWDVDELIYVDLYCEQFPINKNSYILQREIVKLYGDFCIHNRNIKIMKKKMMEII